VEKGLIVFTPFEVKTGRPYKLQNLPNGVNCPTTRKKAAPLGLKRHFYVQKIIKNRKM
jgi:hypothetical protein